MGGLKQSKLEFLSGGGEMGERIRAFDWTKTPLGAPQDWEQSLKTCIRIILTSRQPMFVWWGKDLINIYNDPYKAIVGGKHPIALGQPAEEVWKEIWDEAGTRAKTVMATNEGTYDEALLLIMERYGYPEETYYTFSYSPVPGDQGGTRGIICANTDDTQRIVNERALKALRDLGIRTANRKKAEEIYLKAAEVLGENPRDFPFALRSIKWIKRTARRGRLTARSGFPPMHDFPTVIDINRPEALWESMGEVIKTNKPVLAEVPAEFSRNLPTGYWPIPSSKLIFLPVTNTGRKYPFAVLVSAISPYRQLDENYRSLFELFTDQLGNEISNLYAYEEERKRAEALSEIDKAKTAFFSNISHEFRTPLTLILGPLGDYLSTSQHVSAIQQKENIEAAHRNAGRLLRLVNSLLDFSRIEAGRVKAVFQRVDLAVQTVSLANSFRNVIEKAGLSFQVKCDSFPVYADKEMWEKIVLNLLSNAFKYTLKGEISVTLTNQGDQAVLCVADTGVGIPEKELPRMFERFHRIENSGGRTHEGTGIGLSLVYELVKLHYGTINVVSTEGQGSVFTVMIPLGKEHLTSEETALTEKEAAYHSAANAFLAEAAMLVEHPLTGTESEELPTWTDEQNTGSSQAEIQAEEKEATVLLADDNADMLAYVKQLLAPRFKVITAKNGKQALEKISRQLPDIVLSDIMMPEMDGYQLLKTLKESPLTRNIPVILLSARAGEESKVEGIDAGADDYLVKPFSARELLARVRSQIKIRKIQLTAEKRIRQLFMQAPVAIIIYRGSKLMIELINDKALELWGRQREDVLEKSLFELVSEAELTAEPLPVRAYETGEPQMVEEYKLTFERYGQLYTGYFDIIFEPLRDFDGTVTGMMVTSHEVTDKVNAKSKIAESEERLRLALELARIGTWDYDPIQGGLSCSERTAEIFGFSPQDPLSFSLVLTAVKESDRERVVQVISHTLSGESDGNYVMEYDITHLKTKKHRTLRGFGKVLFNERGIAYRLIGTVMDITEERKQKEKLELKVAERTSQLAQSLFIIQQAEQAAQLGSWEWNLHTQTLKMSDNLYRIFGYAPGEFAPTFQNFVTIVHPDDRQTVMEVGKLVFESRQPTENIFRIVRKDGAIRYIHGMGQLFTTDTGEEVIIGSSQDITRQYLQEKEIKAINASLEEKNRELQQQNEFAEAILNASVDVMAVFDRQLRYVTLNKAAYDLYRLKPEDIVGKHILEIFPQVIDSGMYAALNEALSGQTIHISKYRSGVLNRYFENFYIPLQNARQEVYGILAVGHDVNDIAEAAQQLEASNALLEEKNAALLKSNNDLEQFAHVASHDLQEPLRKIQTFTELLTKNLHQEAEATKYLSKIQLSAARMQTLIRDVLNYARLSKSEDRKQETDLNQLLEAIKIDFELLIEQKKATVIYSDLPVIRAIPLQMMQLFSNLISNSLKFSRVDPVITISARKLRSDELPGYPELNPASPHMMLQLVDNGIGFDPQFKQQIFTIFQRLHDRQTYSGTGIGLALCKKIVENHQGYITADAEPDKGAVFTIILPVA
ncbi:MAG: ATP-binding protein [Spirosomataceae bacterium]